MLRDLIKFQLVEKHELANEIYVITPICNVANQLVKILDQIQFTQREEGR